MSTDSALILFRHRLPSRAVLEQQLVTLGYQVDLGNFNIELSKGWVDIHVDGRKTGFDYCLFPLVQDDTGFVPKKAFQVGDTALSFGARGIASIIAVSVVQHAISSTADAYGLIETSLIVPQQVQAGSVQSIALFSQQGALLGSQSSNHGEISDRMAEFVSSLPRLLLIAVAAAVVILGFPRLIAWIGQ